MLQTPTPPCTGARRRLSRCLSHLPLFVLALALPLLAACDGQELVPPGGDSGSGDDVADGEMCTNTCPYANDGECDDGGPGSLFSLCGLGTDCGDCGPRTSSGGDDNDGGSNGEDNDGDDGDDEEQGSGFGDIAIYNGIGQLTSRGCITDGESTEIVFEDFGRAFITGSHRREDVTCGTSGVITFYNLPEGRHEYDIYCQGVHVATRNIGVYEDECRVYEAGTP